MRPILLHGHERSLTQIKYNREGDLLFSVGKDHKPNVWFSHNGERLGTYEGHNGTVWCVDVDEATSKLLTGSADNSAKLWDVQTGTCLSSIKTNTAVRACGISMGNQSCFLVTDARMGHPCELLVYDMRDVLVVSRGMMGELQPIRSIKIPSGQSKITAAVWGPLNKYIYAGHEDGEMAAYDVSTGTKVMSKKGEHEGQIHDIQWAPNKKGYFITASKDQSARLFDAQDLKCWKVYKTDRPVNSAALAPKKNQVILGGGQEASQVTTTVARAGKFEVRFYHRIYAEEIGRVKGHFGPINTVAFHPEGHSFASGGEDGYIRLHHFDEDYFQFDY
jgi:translation initiation factor 3 subunit I